VSDLASDAAAHLLTRDEARRIAVNIGKCRCSRETPEITSGLLWPARGIRRQGYPLS
jgi:hypothetical protein